MGSAVLDQFRSRAMWEALATTRKDEPRASHLRTRAAIPGDTINLVFGIFMAIVGLITIYQTAQLAALHSRSPRKILPRGVSIRVMLLTSWPLKVMALFRILRWPLYQTRMPLPMPVFGR
jgi:hypothetical protein